MQVEVLATAVLAGLLGGVTVLLATRVVASVRTAEQRRREAVKPEDLERAERAHLALEKARAEYEAFDSEVREQAEQVRSSLSRPGAKRVLSRP